MNKHIKRLFTGLLIVVPSVVIGLAIVSIIVLISKYVSVLLGMIILLVITILPAAYYIGEEDK